MDALQSRDMITVGRGELCEVPLHHGPPGQVAWQHHQCHLHLAVSHCNTQHTHLSLSVKVNLCISHNCSTRSMKPGGITNKSILYNLNLYTNLTELGAALGAY